jgi:hypothetical protein
MKFDVSGFAAAEIRIVKMNAADKFFVASIS